LNKISKADTIVTNHKQYKVIEQAKLVVLWLVVRLDNYLARNSYQAQSVHKHDLKAGIVRQVHDNDGKKDPYQEVLK